MPPSKINACSQSGSIQSQPFIDPVQPLPCMILPILTLYSLEETGTFWVLGLMLFAPELYLW